MEVKNRGIVQKLLEMKVGDILPFPAENANAVRATSSNYGFQWNRKYVCTQNREERKLYVKRIK